MAWIGAVVGVVGGLAGGVLSAGDRQRARQAMEEAAADIEALGAAPDESKAIVLEKFRQVGVLTPETEQAINIGFSQVAQIQEDQQLKDVQRGALESLTQRGKVGLTAEDRFALSDIRQQAAQQAEAKRQQIIQSLQARGMGGAGSELAASLQASQGGADTASREGMQQGAIASQNALAAMAQAGQLSGDIAQSEFGRAYQKGSAADEISKFNTANEISRQSRNVGARNEAQASNLATAQRVAEANVQQSNEEAYRQSAARRQYWEDQVSLAGMKAQAKTGQMNQLNKSADATQKQYSDMGSSAGSAYSAYNSKDDNKKPSGGGNTTNNYYSKNE